MRLYKARDTSYFGRAGWFAFSALPLLPLTEDIRRHMRTCAKAICKGEGGAEGGGRKSETEEKQKEWRNGRRKAKGNVEESKRVAFETG